MRPHSRNLSRPSALSRWATMVLLLAVAQGCGGEAERTEPKLTEEQKVCAAADMSDMVGDPEDFRSLFVDGAVPDDSQKRRYKGRSFGASDPKISGNSATMTVVIRDVNTWEVLGEVEWTAEKVGDRWKLKTAPLPDGL